ncbi:hypothetical protein, partial [Bradyrhizobium sp.]|uniref:hypothetical protein n=1 Tax=Bradyrhizobium sp. TaxID=376 RepID=UPI003C719914
PGFRQKSPDVRVLAKMIADRFCCHRPGFGVLIAEPIGKLHQKVFTAWLYVERFIAASQSSFRFFQNQRCRTGTPRTRNFLRRVLIRRTRCFLFMPVLVSAAPANMSGRASRETTGDRGQLAPSRSLELSRFGSSQLRHTLAPLGVRFRGDANYFGAGRAQLLRP